MHLVSLAIVHTSLMQKSSSQAHITWRAQFTAHISCSQSNAAPFWQLQIPKCFLHENISYYCSLIVPACPHYLWTKLIVYGNSHMRRMQALDRILVMPRSPVQECWNCTGTGITDLTYILAIVLFIESELAGVYQLAGICRLTVVSHGVQILLRIIMWSHKTLVILSHRTLRALKFNRWLRGLSV